MSNILTQDEYSKIERQGFKLPYVVQLSKDAQMLTFYGSKHTNDPSDKQFQDILERWGKFADEATKPLAMVEGHYDQISEAATEDATQSIIDGGEAQYLVHLARRDNIPVMSPEPNRQKEANMLAEEFGKENVVFYYTVRQIDYWHRMTEQPDIITETEKMLHLMAKNFQWKDVDFSMKLIDEKHQELFSKPFDLKDETWLYSLITPAQNRHITNKLARRSGEIRDEHILSELKKYWSNGHSIFAVFGSAHAVRLEPAITTL